VALEAAETEGRSTMSTEKIAEWRLYLLRVLFQTGSNYQLKQVK